MKNNPFAWKTRVRLPALLGMVHVQALPGTPFAQHPIADIVALAREEALAYQAAGFDGIILENMHDRPYLKGAVGPEITAAMTRVAVEVRQAVGHNFPMGVQILAGANTEALAVALVADLEFIRAEGCLFGHIADEGWIEACAGPLLRERKRLSAARIGIWADIQKKHSSHMVTGDLTINEWAHGAEFFGLDAVIVTGSATGTPADILHVKQAKVSTSLPVAVGSGVTIDNIRKFKEADALIIGSSVKKGGVWTNPLDLEILKHLVAACPKRRSS